MISLRHFRARFRQTFWLLPSVCVAAAIVLGLLLPEIKLPVGRELLFGGGPESARSFLSSITTAMITMTGLVFSLTVVALQLAAGQFSPRVMRDFLRDRIIQGTLGIFVATFTFAMILQRSVRGVSSGGPASVPQLGLTVAFLLVLASVGLFVAYINRIVNSIRVANIVSRIGVSTRATIEARYPRHAAPGVPAAPNGPPTCHVVAPHPGVIVSANEEALIALAAEDGLVLELVPHMGDYVPAGGRVLAQYGGQAGEEAVLRHVAFDSERTYEQDVAFGFRALVDIAERALSPGVNDPTTAAQAIDVLHDLLRRVAARPEPPRHHLDDDGQLRLITNPYPFADLLDLALEEIAHYGANDVQTPRRLRALLRDIQAIALPQYQPAILRWLDTLPPAISERRRD